MVIAHHTGLILSTSGRRSREASRSGPGQARNPFRAREFPIEWKTDIVGPVWWIDMAMKALLYGIHTCKVPIDTSYRDAHICELRKRRGPMRKQLVGRSMALWICGVAHSSSSQSLSHITLGMPARSGSLGTSGYGPWQHCEQQSLVLLTPCRLEKRMSVLNFLLLVAHCRFLHPVPSSNRQLVGTAPTITV